MLQNKRKEQTQERNLLPNLLPLLTLKSYRSPETGSEPGQNRAGRIFDTLKKMFVQFLFHFIPFDRFKEAVFSFIHQLIFSAER